MATIMSTGQITLVDLTDSRPSSFYLQADKSKIQIENINNTPTLYDPDYTTSALTITPMFFFGNDRVKNLSNADIEYSINNTVVTTEITGDITDTSGYDYFVKDAKLVIQKNISDFAASQLRITAKILSGLRDEETGLATTEAIEADIEFALVTTGKSGTSISRVAARYQVTQTQTPPALNSAWVYDMSSLKLDATNKYLWCHQAVYVVDNVGKETLKQQHVYLMGSYGDKGDDGAPGKSVKSIREQYNISSDKDSPSADWRADPPTSLTTDQFLRTRTWIVYTTSSGGTEHVYLPSEDGALDTTWNLAVETVASTNKALETLQNSYNDLQNQVDGAIDTWYGEEDPTNTNYPATDWTTDAAKIRHNSDLYYNTKSGTAWRYTVITNDKGEVTSASWTLLQDDALAEALGQIQSIGAKVDNKMSIFYGGLESIPVAAEVGDLWIQGEKGDLYKCKEAYTTDFNISTTNWTNKWEVANKNIGRVDILFYKHDSATEAPGDGVAWVTESPEWEQGKYIWQLTRTYDRSGEILAQSDPVCITSASRSIEEVINYYLATDQATGVTRQTSGWETDISKATLTKDKPYLWNYEKVTYTYGPATESDPTIIGNYSKDGAPGRGIVSITEYYLIAANNVTPSFSINASGTPTSSEWKSTIQKATDAKPCLWNAEVVEYSTEPKYVASTPALIGYRGVGVTSSTIYYCRTTNETPPTTTPSGSGNDHTKGWYTDFASVTINDTYKFLWSCTLTILTDGSKQTSAPAIISKYTTDGAPAVFAIVEAADKTVFSDADATNITLTARLMIGGEEASLSADSYVWTAIGSTKTGTGKTLTVSRGDVINVATFVCTITSSTYGTFVDRISLQDKTDPIWCEIISSNGDKFTNGNTRTTLTAVIYGSTKGKYTDEEMNNYYYNWKRYDKDGNPTDFTPTYASEIGKEGYYNAISLDTNAIETKAIFTVEVTTQ